MSTNNNAIENVVVKLGLQKSGESETVFRRFRYSQLNFGDRERAVRELKRHAIAILRRELTDDLEEEIARYTVSLSYTDKDGDKVLIITDHDVREALQEYVEEKIVKIWAEVTELVDDKNDQPTATLGVRNTSGQTSFSKSTQSTISTATQVSVVSHGHPPPGPIPPDDHHGHPPLSTPRHHGLPPPPPPPLHQPWGPFPSINDQYAPPQSFTLDDFALEEAIRRSLEDTQACSTDAFESVSAPVTDVNLCTDNDDEEEAFIDCNTVPDELNESMEEAVDVIMETVKEDEAETTNHSLHVGLDEADNIGSTKDVTEAIRNIVDSPWLPNLRRLSMSGFHFNVKTLETLSECLVVGDDRHVCKIREFRLQNCHFDADATLRFELIIQANSSIEKLSLGPNVNFEGGLVLSTMLHENQNLQELDLEQLDPGLVSTTEYQLLWKHLESSDRKLQCLSLGTIADECVCRSLVQCLPFFSSLRSLRVGLDDKLSVLKNDLLSAVLKNNLLSGLEINSSLHKTVIHATFQKPILFTLD